MRGGGRHFLQIPGPTNVPDRILAAMAMPTIDHRGPEFRELATHVLARIKEVFKTSEHVFIFPGSGTGAWEAALVNTLGPGERVLMVETGHFARTWAGMASALGLTPELIETDWRRGAPADAIAARLAEDRGHAIKAVCVVHSETSTGALSDLKAIGAAIARIGHPALYMVDAVSSLASADLRHDEWDIDVTVSGSQKGLMLPPGLGFNAVSRRALEAAARRRFPRSYWDWEAMRRFNADGFFPYTPATNLLFGLREALAMLLEDEGLDRVFARHARLAEATRRAVHAWGLEILCAEPAEYSPSLTGVLMPAGQSADALRAHVLDAFDTSLGSGLGKLADRVFRIGHLGWFNEPMLCGTLAAVEMGLNARGIRPAGSGVQAAMEFLNAPAARVRDANPARVA